MEAAAGESPESEKSKTDPEQARRGAAQGGGMVQCGCRPRAAEDESEDSLLNAVFES